MTSSTTILRAAAGVACAALSGCAADDETASAPSSEAVSSSEWDGVAGDHVYFEKAAHVPRHDEIDADTGERRAADVTFPVRRARK